MAHARGQVCDGLAGGQVSRRTIADLLPEPVIDTAALAPDAQTELADDLSVVLLLAAFLLRDVFDCSFAQVAHASGRNEDACRQTR